jgi:hypothetical protein
MNSWILCWQEVVPAASRKRLCEKTDYVDLEAPAAKKHAELNLRCVANSQQETMAAFLAVLGIRDILVHVPLTNGSRSGSNSGYDSFLE